jgi:hypothetical protein
MSRTYSSERELLQDTLISSIESNFISLTDKILGAFFNQISLTEERVSIAFYSAIRQKEPDMVDYLLNNGAELNSSQIREVMTSSSFDVFKRVVEHYLPYILQRKNSNTYQSLIFEEGDIDKLGYLAQRGVKLTKEMVSLEALPWDVRRNKNKIIYIIKNIEFNDDDLKVISEGNNLSAFAKALGEYADIELIEVIYNSNFKFLLLNEEFGISALKRSNCNAIDFLLNHNIPISTSCDTCGSAADFISSSKAFGFVLDYSSYEISSSYSLKALLSTIFSQGTVESFDIGCNRINILKKLKSGDADPEELLLLLDTAYKNGSNKDVLAHFFSFLPSNFFAANDVLKNIITNSTKTDPSYFMELTKTKGANFTLETFEPLINDLFRDHIGHYKDGNLAYAVSLFKVAKEHLDHEFYEFAHIRSDFYAKSNKQMLSLFRKSYYSKNDNTKASQIYLLMVVASDEVKIKILSSMTSIEDLRNDIALSEVMKLWGYDPMTILTLPITEKVKIKLMEALS